MHADSLYYAHSQVRQPFLGYLILQISCQCIQKVTSVHVQVVFYDCTIHSKNSLFVFFSTCPSSFRHDASSPLIFVASFNCKQNSKLQKLLFLAIQNKRWNYSCGISYHRWQVSNYFLLTWRCLSIKRHLFLQFESYLSEKWYME